MTKNYNNFHKKVPVSTTLIENVKVAKYHSITNGCVYPSYLANCNDRYILDVANPVFSSSQATTILDPSRKTCKYIYEERNKRLAEDSTEAEPKKQRQTKACLAVAHEISPAFENEECDLSGIELGGIYVNNKHGGQKSYLAHELYLLNIHYMSVVIRWRSVQGLDSGAILLCNYL